jgi:hypothetical protein
LLKKEQQEMMNKKHDSSTNRYLALLAGFTGLYLAYGYASGVALGHAIFELDLFFLVSALFTILVSLTGRPWSATVLGTINGLLLFGDPNAPLGIGLSLIPNGLVFDLALRGGNHFASGLSRKRLVIAGALGNLAMAVAGLLIAEAVGALGTSGVSLIISSAIALVGNPIVGALGALFGTIVVERVGERVRSPLIR